MKKFILLLVVIGAFVMGLACSGGSDPVTPVGDTAEYIIPEGVVAQYTYTNDEGVVTASGTLGRNDEGDLYIIESRGAQIDIDLTPLGLVNASVQYNNPAGTYGGWPYFLKGTTMEYTINLVNYLPFDIGGWAGPANVHTEMRRAWFYGGGVVIGGLMYGEPVFDWYGIIPSGLSQIHDDFYITLNQPSGNFVTTVKVSAPVFFGIFDIIFFDGIGGMFDP